MSRWLISLAGLCLVLVVVASYSEAVRADPLQSANYRFDESSVGAGGLIQSSSSNFQSNGSIGDLGVGNSASSNYQIEVGSQTTDRPALTFVINNSDANFGSFSPSGPATATATFTISNYTSYGYVVQIVGNPPSNGSHVIDALATGGTSQFGIEQFGINLVENTSPVFGSDPVHGLFASGEAATNYNTPDEFRYVSGETIALANESSGETTYTISYLINVSSLTPGGQYTSNQTIVVTGTY